MQPCRMPLQHQNRLHRLYSRAKPRAAVDRCSIRLARVSASPQTTSNCGTGSAGPPRSARCRSSSARSLRLHSWPGSRTAKCYSDLHWQACEWVAGRDGPKNSPDENFTVR
jgi:hypothetical protein